LKLWVSLHTEGEKRLADDVEYLAAQARKLYLLLLDTPSLDVYCPPETNIVCARLSVGSESASNATTKELVDLLNGRGIWSVGQVRMRDRLYLKICLMNPRISSMVLGQLANEIGQFTSRFKQRGATNNGDQVAQANQFNQK
jgi:L-2,4-diaminobutyrate decarboxylase